MALSTLMRSNPVKAANWSTRKVPVPDKENIEPRAARQAVARVQRIRRGVNGVVASSSGNGVRASRERVIEGHVVEIPLAIRVSCFARDIRRG